MTDHMTDASVKELLDGATPGPWRADGEPWNRVVWSSAENRVCFMAHSNGLNDERDIATSNLAAAAPDLARALLAARADTEAAVALALEEASNGNRPIPFDRDTAGRFVREAWVRWAETQPCPKPSWLVPYDELDEEDKEADRQIGEAVARWALIHDAARASLAPASGVAKLAALRERAEKAEADMRVWMLTAQLADQRATDLTAELAAANAREAGLRKALEVIREWTAFPPSGRFWRNGDGTISARPMPYGAAFGSNGERDFMRQVARAALAQPSTEGGE